MTERITRETKIREFIRQNPKNKEELDDLKIKIDSSLRLEEGIPNSRKTTRERVVSEISSTILDFSKLKKIPAPNVGLMAEWSEVGSRERNWVIPAVSNITQDHPDGIILFNPIYFQAFFSQHDKLNITNLRYQSSIRVLTGHEAYHIWEKKKFPNAVLRYKERDAGLILSEIGRLKRSEIDTFDLSESVISHGEKAANIYERAYDRAQAGVIASILNKINSVRIGNRTKLAS